jgi:antitoxin VapB
MATAKLFKHGGSQAVRLPKELRLPGDEVLVEKVGDAVVLRPMYRSRWADFFARPGIPDDFLADRYDAPPQEREPL